MTGPYGTTPGPWIYSPDRDTSDSIIHTANAVEQNGWISCDRGGVVGSSEWTHIEPNDARAIAQVPAMLELVQRLAAMAGKGGRYETGPLPDFVEEACKIAATLEANP